MVDLVDLLKIIDVPVKQIHVTLGLVEFRPAAVDSAQIFQMKLLNPMRIFPCGFL